MPKKPAIDSSRGIDLRPGLKALILDDTNHGEISPSAGLHVSQSGNWLRARGWSCHRHGDELRIQMVYEPYPEGTSQNTAWEIANLLDQQIEDFTLHNRYEPFPEDAKLDSEILRRRAATNTHTVATQHLKELIHAATGLDLPPGATAAIAAAIAANDHAVARHLLGRSLKHWRQAADEEQVGALLESAARLDMDPYAISAVARALGHSPSKFPQHRPDTPPETRLALEQAALHAGLPPAIAARVQEAL